MTPKGFDCKPEQLLRVQATALQIIPCAVVITDKQGTIQRVNLAFTGLTGYTAEEAVGQNPRLLRSGRHPRAFYQHLWKTLLSGQTWRGNVTNRRKDGSLNTTSAPSPPSPTRPVPSRISSRS